MVAMQPIVKPIKPCHLRHPPFFDRTTLAAHTTNRPQHKVRLSFLTVRRNLVSISETDGDKTAPELGGTGRRCCMMGFCICPLETPARLLWTTSFFRHKLMIF
ncbi:hypothetical protein RIF29_18769 [Crotalaria pallida]|uniref:Uncharacterized protein n=1 Tax=Crotalaria pallida TaxID=3830 RepID=A0AAN9EYB9_CROPI